MTMKTKQDSHEIIAHAIIRKDGFTPSRPWTADLIWPDGNLIWPDGKIWKSWAYGFKTRKSLIQHINAVGQIEIING